MHFFLLKRVNDIYKAHFPFHKDCHKPLGDDISFVERHSLDIEAFDSLSLKKTKNISKFAIIFELKK